MYELIRSKETYYHNLQCVPHWSQVRRVVNHAAEEMVTVVVEEVVIVVVVEVVIVVVEEVVIVDWVVLVILSKKWKILEK